MEAGVSITAEEPDSYLDWIIWKLYQNQSFNYMENMEKLL